VKTGFVIESEFLDLWNCWNFLHL